MADGRFEIGGVALPAPISGDERQGGPDASSDSPDDGERAEAPEEARVRIGQKTEAVRPD